MRRAERTIKRRQQRRAKGVQPRAVYLEKNHLSRTKPWALEGKSRATWYEQKRLGDTLVQSGDTLVQRRRTGASHSTLLPTACDGPVHPVRDKKADFRGSKKATRLPWSTPTVMELTDRWRCERKTRSRSQNTNLNGFVDDTAKKTGRAAFSIQDQNPGEFIPEIGKTIGNRDHSTVLHACRKVESMCKSDQKFAGELGDIEKKIRW
jgi:hypothetical protein